MQDETKQTYRQKLPTPFTGVNSKPNQRKMWRENTVYIEKTQNRNLQLNAV